MRTAHAPRRRLLMLLSSVFVIIVMGGCNDESKTSGTMVQRSEEDTAHLKSKLKTYKAGRTEDQYRAPRAKK